MKIAMVASEASPFIKTGGLGDVMEALPLALAQIPKTKSAFPSVLRLDQIRRPV